MKQYKKLATLGLCALPFVGSSASAEDWEFQGSIYLWAAGIEGTTAAGTKIDVEFSDLAENLEFGILGSLEAKRGRFFVLGDLVYLNVSDGTASTRPLLPGLPGGGFTINGAAKVEVKGTVFNLVGGYEFINENGFTLQGVAGARYLNLDTELNLAISVGPALNSVVVRPSGDYLDAIVGVRGRADISENWFVPYYFDIGAGESDFTWQAFAGVGYDFGRSEVTFGYRHIEWDFGTGAQISDIAFSGPGFRYSYRF